MCRQDLASDIFAIRIVRMICKLRVGILAPQELSHCSLRRYTPRGCCYYADYTMRGWNIWIRSSQCVEIVCSLVETKAISKEFTYGRCALNGIHQHPKANQRGFDRKQVWIDGCQFDFAICS